MQQCKMCKKKGLFLRVNQYGVCFTCWEKYQINEKKKQEQMDAYNKDNLFVVLSFVAKEIDRIMEADTSGNQVSISDSDKAIEIYYDGVVIGKVRSKDIQKVRNFISDGYKNASITCEDLDADAMSTKSGYIVELHIER